MKGAFKKSFKKPGSFLSVIIIIITIVSGILSNHKLTSDYEVYQGELNIFCIDVGQGDCTYIVFPDGKNMLIDAGEKESNAYEKIENFNPQKIDYLVITHPHSDHAGGMKDIVENYRVEKLIMPDAVSPASFFDKLLDAVDSKNIPLILAQTGLIIHKEENLIAEVLSPCKDGYNDLNNMSAVIKITYGENEFLFMGDAEKEAERDITHNVNADFIKLGHHGSDSSSSKSFLKRVNPEYAVISVGEFNSYGHPDEDVLKLCKDMGINVYRTDRDGNVCISSDGKNITIKTQK